MKMPSQPISDRFELDAAGTHAVLNFILSHWMPRVIDRQAAAETRLRIAWVFTGPGGGTWTMQIAGGQTTVREEPSPEVLGHLQQTLFDSVANDDADDEKSPEPDLIFTQTPEAFFKTLHLWLDPMLGLLTGEIKVKGFEHVRALNELFPKPRSAQGDEAL